MASVKLNATLLARPMISSWVMFLMNSLMILYSETLFHRLKRICLERLMISLAGDQRKKYRLYLNFTKKTVSARPS